MPNKIQTSVLSDTGLVRENNEDAWDEVPELNFYTLADGMGGHRAGEVAAQESVTTVCGLIRRALNKRQGVSLKEMEQIIRSAIIQTNQLVYQLGCSSESLRGMGTTLCCIGFYEDKAICAHVGDSRIYRLSKKKLDQLTQDDTLLRELRDLGQPFGTAIPESLYKNVLTKAIGTELTVEPSVRVWEASQGDVFFMCTDGLSDLLSLQEMQSILNAASDIEEAANIFVSTAIERGGHDNITVLLMKVKSDEASNSR